MLDEDESRRWREGKCRVDRLYRLHVPSRCSSVTVGPWHMGGDVELIWNDTGPEHTLRCVLVP
jgi:hypothetical protein